MAEPQLLLNRTWLRNLATDLGLRPWWLAEVQGASILDRGDVALRGNPLRRALACWPRNAAVRCNPAAFWRTCNMDFDSFIAQAWDDHANDAAAVAARLDAQATDLVTQEAQIAPLAHLAHHVFGEHLGQWQQGLRFQRGLARMPLCDAAGSSGQAVRRFVASLQLAGGLQDTRGALDTGDRIRVTALAGASLAERDTVRAGALLQEAVAEAEAAQLADADPCHRTLAAVGNNLASALETKTTRTPAERDLMIQAAQIGRRFWGLAGTWLEVERAEYRLAMSWLKAGDAVRARRHAQACLEGVQDNGGAALEQFFAWEALARVEQATGNPSGHAQALLRCRDAFAGLAASDQAWCQASLDALSGS